MVAVENPIVEEEKLSDNVEEEDSGVDEKKNQEDDYTDIYDPGNWDKIDNKFRDFVISKLYR